MSRSAKIRKIIIPILILIVGIVVMKYLVSHRTPPAKREKVQPGALVEIITVHPGTHPVTIRATGIVQPRQAASIAPQVSGRVEKVNPRLVAGGFFAVGELLFAIEDVDYRLALEQASANLIKARVEVMKIQSLATVARQEWERLQPEGREKPNPLVLYEPQLQEALAQQTAAKAKVEQAKINLERTKIRAPFNCFIRSEKLDPGQYVKAGSPVIEINGTDNAEVITPLPSADFRWLDIPRGKKQRQGSTATVVLDDQQQTYRFSGRVVRSLGEVDPRGRMARVVIAVSDPYRLKDKSPGYHPELQAGMFVKVIIHGRQLEQVYTLPREALRDQETVWIVDQDNTLQIKSTTIVHRERQTVLVSAGLADGDRVVLTNLYGAAPGMKLRPLNREKQP
jgi:RND family efflux transporter MFP subunit